MRKGTVSLLGGLIALSCIFALRAAAQTFVPWGTPIPYSSCTEEVSIIDSGLGSLDGVPQTAVCWVPPPPVLSYACFYYLNTCAPPAGPNETRCLACTARAANPIDLSTGNVFINQTDISLPGLGGGLHLVRTWNSTWPSTQMGMMPFMFGPNWTATYQERVYVGSDQFLKYARPDGSFWSLGFTARGGNNPTYATSAPGNAGATAQQNLTTGSWTVTLKNGEQHTFDPVSGDLTSIIDRNGNTTTISHDALNRISTVTDAASRHLFFNYVNNSFLVSSVTSDVGITLSYAYDAQGRLSQVTKPDNTIISFQYDSNSNITAVLDTNGIVLESHTYDSSSRGLTSSRANGVSSVTVQYPAVPPPSGNPLSEP